MQTTRKLTIIAALAAVALTAACAARTAERGRQVSVNVHTVLATLDDGERALYESGAVPAWTAEKHQEFSKRLVVALKAGKALNESVRLVPVTGQAKADLATVSAELGVLTSLVEGVLPPDHPVRLTLGKATQVVLEVLPLFLE